MKFVSVWKVDPRAIEAGPTQEQMASMGQLIGEMMSAGVLLDTGGVMSNGVSMRVRRSGSNVSVTDGPFTESKEVVGGFALLKVSSKEEALEWMRRFAEIAGDGEAELHEVTELS
jgi:hypothetical protein